jgi:hypothetical protein
MNTPELKILTDFERLCAEHNEHRNHIFWQLAHYANHPQQAFDVTFYDREPILEVTLAEHWAGEFSVALEYGTTERYNKLLNRVIFSDGTAATFESIGGLNFMPPNLKHLNLNHVDLVQGEDAAGFGGETVRQIIRETYRCRSRAEENYFLARWIAS